MSSEVAAAVAVTVQFIEGDIISLDLVPADTVDNLRSKVAAARGVIPHRLSFLCAEIALLDSKQHPLELGTEFACVLRETLGVEWALISPSAPCLPGYAYAVVAYEDRVLIIGGVQDDYKGQPQDEFCDNAVWAIGLGSDWELLARPPWRPRRYHAAAVDGAGRLLVAGGEDHCGTIFRDVWFFDGSFWQQLGDGPWDGVPDASAGTARGMVVVVDKIVYELSTDSWKFWCQVPENVQVTSCVVDDEDILLGSSESNSVLIRSAGCWSIVDLPGGSKFYTMVCAGPAGQRFVYQHTHGSKVEQVVIANLTDWNESVICPLLPKETKEIAITDADAVECGYFVQAHCPWKVDVSDLKFPLTLVIRLQEGAAFGNFFELHGNESRELATALVPPPHHKNESMGRVGPLQVWGGIGLLTGCRLFHSK